jgi:hypothetical protein
METLTVAGTRNTPEVVLNREKGIFKISGPSLPDDAAAFYRPVLTWFEDYATRPNSSTELLFQLEYLNTASAKVILDLLSTLTPVENTRVVWCFQEDDEDMEERGEELAELVKIPFEFRAL